MKLRVFVLLAAVLLAVMLTGCTILDPLVSSLKTSPAATESAPAEESEAPTAKPTPTPTPEPTPEPTPTPSPYQLGKPFKVGDVTYTVTFVDKFDGSGFGKNPVITNIDATMTIGADGKGTWAPSDKTLRFVTAVIDIKNDSSSAVDPLIFNKCTVKDGAGAVYTAAMNPTKADSIAAGASGKMAFIAAVKTDAKALVLDLTEALQQAIQITLQ